MTTLSDRIHETTEVTGTGTLTLLGAVIRKRAFSTLADGTLVPYVIEGRAASTEWEEGYGTKSGTTLTRTTVLFSSNAGALVNFSAGVKDVFLVAPSAQLPVVYATTGLSLGTGASASSTGTAFGYNANGSSLGAAVGSGAIGNDYGAAVGRYTSGYTYGAAVGNSATGNNYGVAVGYGASGSNYGVAVGSNSFGNNYGAAVGYGASTYAKDRAVALGYYSVAQRYREMVKSADGAATTLQSWSLVNWYGTTADATATEILLGGTAAQRCVLLNNSAFMFSMQVVCGVTGGGNTSGWEIKGVIKRGAGAASTALVGTPTVTSVGTNDVNHAIAVSADTTNGSLNVTVTGVAATTIKWNVTATLSEMRF
jgi:hypothetical protein